MEKRCPRCHKTFECQHHNIGKCDCTKLILSPESYEYISNTYEDCLCIECLEEIEKEQQRSPKQSAVLKNK